MKNVKKGFTLVELLVVMVIIGLIIKLALSINEGKEYYKHKAAKTYLACVEETNEHYSQEEEITDIKEFLSIQYKDCMLNSLDRDYECSSLLENQKAFDNNISAKKEIYSASKKYCAEEYEIFEYFESEQELLSFVDKKEKEKLDIEAVEEKELDKNINKFLGETK